MPIGRRNARVSQHYKAAMASTFREYPNSKYIILLEEDLDVSIDFFRWILKYSITNHSAGVINVERTKEEQNEKINYWMYSQIIFQQK